MKEVRARQTLRRIVGEEQYNSFLRKSMVTVRGKSGRFYSVRPGHSYVKVWDKGELVGNLCIQLSGSFPPTDSVIMRCLMIWNQEDEFWNRANAHGFSQPLHKITPQDTRSLVEIVADLKRKTGEKEIVSKCLGIKRKRLAIEKSPMEALAMQIALMARVA